jgi:hypothetical protein
MRFFKRRESPRQVEEKLSALVDLAENAAEQIYLFAVDSGQPLPDRERVEIAARNVVRDFLAPQVAQAVGRGTDPVEANAYADLVAAQAQLAFQTRWYELVERRGGEPSAGE